MKNVFNSEFKCQRVASAISGWDPLDTGARDDWYYEECHTDLEKLEHIIHYSYDVLKIELNGIELLCVFNYLEKKFSNNNEKTHYFYNIRSDYVRGVR